MQAHQDLNSKKATPLPIRDLGEMLSVKKDEISTLFSKALKSVLREMQHLSSNADHYLDRNTYAQASADLQSKASAITSFFEGHLHSHEGETNGLLQSQSPDLNKILNYNVDDLCIVTESELSYQLKLEGSFSSSNSAFEKALIYGGWKSNFELMELEVATELEIVSPGYIANLMQETMDYAINSKQTARIAYRFMGAILFEDLSLIYEDLTSALREVSYVYAKPDGTAATDKPGAEHTGQGGHQEYNQGPTAAKDQASEAVETQGTKVDVTGLINNWEIPGGFFEEDSISNIDLDQLTPDTQIQTLDKEGVSKLLEQLSLRSQQGNNSNGKPSAIRSALKDALSSLSGEGMLTVIDRVSENIVNLVSHLFENIINDDDLISDVSYQISRVQLPIMRLALSDTSLFQSPNHSARQYINLLGELGIKISSEEEEGYETLKNSIEELLREFEKDPYIYERLTSSLEEYIENSDYNVEQINQTSQLEDDEYLPENQCPHALEFLNSQNELLTNELVYHRFLKIVWGALLSRISNEQGIASDAWREAAEMYGTILWSTQADCNQKGKRHVLRHLPKIVNGMQNLFKTYGISDKIKTALLDQMLQIHLLIIRGTDGTKIIEDTSANIDLFQSLSGKIIDPTDDSQAPLVANSGDSSASRKNNGMNDCNDLSIAYQFCLKATKDIDFGEEVDISALANQLSEEDLPPVEEPNELKVTESSVPILNTKVESRENVVKKTFDLVNSFKVGSLFEYDLGERKARYQLTAVSTVFGQFTFVDFQSKRLIKPKPELVMDIIKGKVKRINSQKLFDDTLENVVTQIQSHSA